MKNEIALKPSYWASVSGGKDSLLMLKIILENLDKYPLNGVVHFELEIDYPFVKNVVDYMETECNKIGIPFVRIKPTKSWYELYEKYGFPTMKTRWCNSEYKLNAQSQLVQFMKQKGYNTYFYIGYCYDEVNRYGKRNILTERYPLVEEQINESEILEWAKNEPLFNDYYKFNDRCGCMLCPLSSFKNLAYLFKYYPDKYNEYIRLAKKTEIKRAKELGRPFSVVSSNPKYNIEYRDKMVREKYLPKLEEKIKQEK